MKNDLLNGKPVRSILSFALPIMASSMLQYNYNLVDNIIVGRFVGTDALAAVGNVGSINSFIIGASLGLTAGFTIPVAQSFGAGDKKKMNKYAGNSISLALLIGLIIVIVAHILSTPLLKLINTPDDIIEMSSQYVNIIYYAVPIQMSLNNFNAISRAVGDSKKPLHFLIVSVIVNLCLDLLFVGYFKWGVVGAAWATALSQLVAAVLSAISVLKHNKELDIQKTDLLISGRISWTQIKLGVPISLQFTITSIGSMVLQKAVNGFGSNVIAGFTAAGRVEQLTNIPMSGLGVGTMTFVSQNYGAGNYRRIINSVKKILLLDIIVSVVCSIILFVIGPSVVTLFMSEYNEQIMFAAKRYLLAIAECYSLVAVLFVFRNTLQGLGFTYSNMIAGAGELFGRIAVALIFTPLMGFDAICYAGPAAWLLADIPLVIIYLTKEKNFKKLAIEKGE
ncbi:MAG: MATE family efflux transporter [Eubacteriales bacterium]|nr:MATE family efflux transporter [Eubacteriales bacterium]